MSPEQVRGRAVDARSDIYSLGVTLFEGLTGHTPFEGDNQFDIMQQHLSAKPPSVSKWGVDAPPGVDRLLDICMGKDVRERYQNALELRAALEAELPMGGSAPAARPRKGWSSKTRALALGGLVAAGGVVAFVILRQSPPPARVVTQDKAAPHDKAGGQKASTQAGAQKKGDWFEPLALAGVTIASDEIYEEDRLRLQSVKVRPPAAMTALRDTYRAVREKLGAYMRDNEIEVVRNEAAAPPPPLTVVLVPQSVLQAPALWPGTQVKADVEYPSRYMPRDRTLFLADAPGFADELPYGIAMHRFANILPLTNGAVLSLAEKFEAYYKQKAPR
jgi:hypothetical protein